MAGNPTQRLCLSRLMAPAHLPHPRPLCLRRLPRLNLQFTKVCSIVLQFHSSHIQTMYTVDRFSWSAMSSVPENASSSAADSDQSEDVVLDVWQNSETEQDRGQDEREEHDTDSDDDIVRSFERSISSVLSPRVLNTILGGDADSRSARRRDAYPPLNPMDLYMADQHHTRSPRSRWDISSGHDNEDDDDPMLMDWVYNSSMDEVD